MANPEAHTAIDVQRHAEGAYHMGVSSGPYNTLCQGGCKALLRAGYGPWYSGFDFVSHALPFSARLLVPSERGAPGRMAPVGS